MTLFYNIAAAVIIGFVLATSCNGNAQDNAGDPADSKPQERTEMSEKETKETTEKVTKSDEEWRRELSEEEYRVLRQQGTEAAFSGKYVDFKKDGTFVCAACGNPLFSSETKYDSGSGWPSFWQPISEDAVEMREDRGWLTTRTEVICSRCGGHLGHVFRDGPRPTGLRYCVNSVSLDFDEGSEETAAESAKAEQSTEAKK